MATNGWIKRMNIKNKNNTFEWNKFIWKIYDWMKRLEIKCVKWFTEILSTIKGKSHRVTSVKCSCYKKICDLISVLLFRYLKEDMFYDSTSSPVWSKWRACLSNFAIIFVIFSVWVVKDFIYRNHSIGAREKNSAF